MKQIYAWFNKSVEAAKNFESAKKIETAKNFALSSYQQIKYAANIVYSSLNYETASSFINAWRGFAVPLRLEETVPAVMESKELREMYWHNAYYNLLKNQGFVFITYSTQLAIMTALPTLHEFYGDKALIGAVTILLGCHWLQASAYGAFINMAASEATEKNAKKGSKKYSNNKLLFKSANNKELEALATNFSSPIYHNSKIFLAEIVSWSPLPLNFIPVAGIKIMARGQNIISYNLEQQTLDERQRFYAEHNAFIFGLGFSYWLTAQFISGGIYSATGIYGRFLDAAIEQTLLPFYVMAVRLIDKPLQSDKEGHDYFFYVNYLTEKIISDITDYVVGKFKQPGEKFDWLKIKKDIQNHWVYQWTSWLLFEREMLSIRRFVNTKPVQLYLDMTREEIRSLIQNKISVYRESTLIRLIPQGLLSEDTRTKLTAVLSVEMGNILKFIDTLLEKPNPNVVTQKKSPETTYGPSKALLNEIADDLRTPRVKLLDEVKPIEDYEPPQPLPPSTSEKSSAPVETKFEEIMSYYEWMMTPLQKSPPLFRQSNLFAKNNNALKKDKEEKKNLYRRHPVS